MTVIQFKEFKLVGSLLIFLNTVNRIRLVKENRAKQIEDVIINQARMGFLRTQIDEQTLIQLLSKIPDKTATTGSVTVSIFFLHALETDCHYKYKRVDKIGEQEYSLDDLEQLLED